MRRVKRVLLALVEVGVLIVGFLLALALATVVEALIPVEAEGVVFRTNVASFSFLLGLIATFAAFVMVMRRNAVRRLEYDAADYPIRKASRMLHPRRERRKRVARNVLVWVPSAMAAFVLFYFPQASHMINPRATYLAPYRVQVPWSFVIFPLSSLDQILVFGTAGKQGPLGITRMWIAGPFSSSMNFSAREDDHLPWPGGGESVAGSDLMIGKANLSCREFVFIRRKDFRTVFCRTPAQAGRRTLFATFRGDDADRAEFYDILRGVRLLQFAK